MAPKKVLISGASRGLGRTIAEQLASNGEIVGVNYLNSASAAEEIAAKYPDRIMLLHADVRDPIAVENAVNDFGQRHGGIDVVVNNAGVHFPRLLCKKPVQQIRSEIETNLFGSILFTKAALPFMMKQRNGLIISVSSVAANNPRPGLAVYSASKAGLESFTIGIAAEYKSRNIRAIALRFGPIQTDMLAQMPEAESRDIQSRMLAGRASSAAEAASIVVRIIRDEVDSSTGVIFTYDGGYSLGA